MIYDYAGHHVAPQTHTLSIPYTLIIPYSFISGLAAPTPTVLETLVPPSIPITSSQDSLRPP